MRPSSTCTAASGTGHGLAHAEAVDGSTRLPSPAGVAASASPLTVTCWPCASFPGRGGGNPLRAFRTESPGTTVAVVTEQRTAPHRMAPIRLSCYSRTLPKSDLLPSFLSPRVAAAPPFSLRTPLSKALLCSLLTSSAAATRMLASTGARRHPVRVTASRQQHAAVQGVTVLRHSHNRQVRRLLEAVVAVDGGGRPPGLRLGVAVRALATATTPSTSTDTDAPPASPESFLDLNEAPVHPVLSSSSSVSSGDASAPARRESSHRFTAKQRRQQQPQQEQSSRGRNRQRKERRSGSQGSLHQNEHGATTLRGRSRHGELPPQQQPGPLPHKQMRHVHSSGHHGGTTSSAAPPSAGGASAHGRRGSSPVRRSGAVSASSTYARTAKEEVSTTWSGSAGRRGDDRRERGRRSGIDTSATGQPSRPASCDPGTSPQRAPPPPTTYTNTGAPSCAALRRLVKSHRTFRKNYEALRKSDKVAAAFELWCAEAVAHSRLVEHLASALGGDSQAVTTVRLLLTGASKKAAAADSGAAAATSPTMSAAETLAVLEVPLSVVDWLNEPIVMPDLGARTLMEFVHKVLSPSHGDKAPANDCDVAGAGELFAASAGDSPAAPYWYGRLEAVEVWYDAWGRQQHYRESAEGLFSSNTEPAAPSLKASIALWHRRQRAVQDVLLSHLTEGGRPSVLDALPVCPAACDSADTRDTTPVECGPVTAASTSGAPVQPDGNAAARPDQFVEGATRELLPYLIEFLQTLSAFKAAREEAKMHAEYHALLENAVAVQSGSAQAAADAAAQGTYTHLCLVARRFRASLPVELHPPPAASDIADKPLGGDGGVDAELRTAAQQYLRSISKVDKVASHSAQSSSKIERSTGDAGTHETTGAQSSSLALAERAGAAPSYSVAVLDICIGVVLRCLLFYLPALSAKDRGHVLQQLSAPWLTLEPEESARVACWSAFFGVADFLSKACALKRRERIGALPSAMGGLSNGDCSTSSASFTVDHSTLSTLQGVVQQLRSLCWPTVLDRHSSIVQHALCLLPAASEASTSPSSAAASVSDQRRQQRRPPTEALSAGSARGTASSSTVAAAPPHSTQPRPPAWSDVVAVVRGSESRQRLGYELLFLFLGALRCGKENAFPAPVKATAAAAADASVEKPAWPHHRPSDRRRLNTVCIYALDVDSFIAERMSDLWPAGDAWPLLRTQPSCSAGRAVAPPGSRPAPAELLAEQTAHPYGLSRVALCTFSDSLLESWSTLSLQRAQILMVALQRAVAAPAALTLRSLLPNLHSSARAGCELSGTRSSATPPHAVQLAARRAEWRAVAPVMFLYTTRACPSLWRTMWAYISSQMKSLLRQVEEMMRSAQASAGDEQGGDVATRGERRWSNEEVEACYKQLEELATMCAWLVAMVPSVCGKWLAVAGAATSEPAQASAREHTERVKAGFERCVKGLLAVWTKTGASADAAEQLLTLFSRHPSSTPTPVDFTPVRAANNGAVDDTAQGAKAPLSAQEETGTGEAVTLLAELAAAAQTHVWTRALYGAVELWIKKTRYIQAQSRGIMETVQLMPPAEASTSALAAMTAAAPGRAADDRSRAGETVTNGGSCASVPTAPHDVDLALLAWWRSTAEEDIGLPSARVYLAQVYTELLRIVSARAVLAPSTPLPERAHVGHPLDSERDSVLGGASNRAGAVDSGDEPTSTLRGDTPLSGAAEKTIFSAAEVVVILRVLSSIAARGVATVTLGRLTERASGRGVLGKTSSAGPAENAVGVESTSGNADSIIDSLRRAAVYATVADKEVPSTTTPDSTASKDAGARGLSTATDGDESGNPTRVGVAEEATAHDRGNAAALSAQMAVQRIEEALLSSLTAHSGALPATTMVEATWLRLLPLSTLQKLLDHRESSAAVSAGPDAPPPGLSSNAPPCKAANSGSSNAQPTACADLATTAATPSPPRFAPAAVVASGSAPQLDGSLRESPSPWVRKLHDAVLTSCHSRHIGICLVSSLYSVLAASQKRDDSTQPLSASTSCDGSRGAVSAATVSCGGTSETASSCAEDCDVARDGPSLATSRLRCFLARLRTSCAEAVVLFHRARRQHADLTAASGEGDASSSGGADADDANASRVGLKASAWAAAAEVDGDSKGEAEAGTLHAATPHQQHGQRFCNVLVVTSELHERLTAYAETLACAAARCSGAEQGADQDTLRTSRNGKPERMRHLLRLLYASLLDAVADFVPYAEHGNAVEVMQMLGVITRRMPWQQCAQASLAQALPLEKDGQFGDHTSDETSCEAVPLAKRGGGVAEAGAAARPSAPRDGDEEGVSIDPLLVCFREQVTRLMPYVDAEVLRCTKARLPQLLNLALIGSAKSSVEYVLRSVPVSTRGSLQRREGPCAAAAEATRSRSTLALSPVSRSAAKVSASESASHGATTEAEPGRLGLSTLPLWSQAPLESLLHRIAMDRLMASRHALYLCTLTVNAPEFSAVLLPLTQYLRDARARISWAMLEVVFKAVAVSAVNFQRHHQAEMLLRSDLLPLSPSLSPGSDQTPGSAAHSPADRASAASAAERPRRGGGGGDASQRGGIALPRSSTDCAALRVGEMRYPHRNGSGASAPLFRTAAVPSAVCNAPSQLRHAWGDLARRLLHEEDDVAVSDVSLWVSALYCGAMVNCAGTQLFEQLLACLVFGTTTPAASAATTTTRIATLDVVGWTLVLEACGTASDHHYRQAYQSLLRDEFVPFLERAAASADSDEGGVSASSASSASYPTWPPTAAVASGRAVLDDALPLAGAWRCGLLEAIPQLFVEDAAFWRRVKNCVETWCAAIARDPAEVASESPSAPRTSTSAARRSWVTQLQQSFNWAAQCAGHSSLVFSDNTWTTETANADAHAVAEWMRIQLEALGASAASVTTTPEAPPNVSPPRGGQTASLRG
ncbi:hypothetical protein conserved [Leishmania donovani]|uniref:Hypothetical_protein_conserved n=1 Tax=Leishmania donovani TaxID=5661 RepID=A0A6J8FJY2_LEIDO|nr:hypothetical protein conserved [Leishmania donovani]VDZ46192.1 hypothetical_protein_conserved [Leishmania donovani]